MLLFRHLLISIALVATVPGCGTGLCSFSGCASLLLPILGQPDAISNTANNGGLSGATMQGPQGVASDGTRLFVADASNNRVLVWNSIPTSTGQEADFALGQTDLESNTANSPSRSASTLSGPRTVAVSGNTLYVADTNNHRVLVWTTLPTSSGEAADFTLGQPNFANGSINNGGLDGGSLNFPYGVFATDGTLYVADQSNSRVLMWTTAITSNNQSADRVLGQLDFTSNSANMGGGTPTAASVNFPRGVFSDGTQIFVADSSNNRIMGWNAFTSNGQASSFVLGQPDSTSGGVNNPSLSAASMSFPQSVISDGTRLFVADRNNERVLSWSSIPTATGQAANRVYGQVDFESATANSGGLSANSLDTPANIYSDGARIFVADQSNHRVTSHAIR